MDTRRRVSLLFVFIFTVILLTGSSYAIPAFSRQYGTSCATCHVNFPKLNDFGKAFKDAGFKFPKDDETFLKVPPVMLGSPAQKELWPHTIWPGTIPGLPPIGLRFNTFFQVAGRNRNNFNLQTPGDPTALNARCWVRGVHDTDLPAALLARMLGIHITVAVAWQRASSGDWTSYAAEVSRRTDGVTAPFEAVPGTPG